MLLNYYKSNTNQKCTAWSTICSKYRKSLQYVVEWCMAKQLTPHTLELILVHYTDKFIHGFVKFLIVLLCSLLLAFVLNNAIHINLLEYWATLPDLDEVRASSLAHHLVSFEKDLTLCLSSPRCIYKWVPATCCWELPCDGLASHPKRVAILL